MLFVVSVLTVLLSCDAFSFSKRTPSYRSARTFTSSLRMTEQPQPDYALLFDCDGVIVETEELHRIAYNKAFEAFGLELSTGQKVTWDVAYFGGGKPKMRYYFTKTAKEWPTITSPTTTPPPTTDEEKIALVDQLQDKKTEIYIKIVEELATARPGVLELMDEALADPTIKVGICSAATRAGFEKITDAVVGKERLSKLDVVIAGDDVSEKKPSPMIYNKAVEVLGIPPERCVVIEDSLVGLKAAKAANMRCIITYTDSTALEDFYASGADAKVKQLAPVTLQDIFEPLRKGQSEILVNFRDPKSTGASARTTSVSGTESVPKAVPAYKGWTPAKLLR